MKLINDLFTGEATHDNKALTACFTGHRRIPKDDFPLIKQKLDVTVNMLIKNGIIFFGNGGACGFDHLAACAVLEARKHCPNIKLIMVLPCTDQDKRWIEPDKQAYRYLLDNADKTVYVSEIPYFSGCMEKRNLHLILHSSICVAYMKHGRSGTSQTVRMAKERGLKIINIAENLKEGGRL